MMHFPTSLPRGGSGSPAAKVVVDPNLFNGPVPPRSPRPRIPPRPLHRVARRASPLHGVPHGVPHGPPTAQLATPVYSYEANKSPWSNTASRDTLVSNEKREVKEEKNEERRDEVRGEKGGERKVTMSGALPNRLPRSSFFSPRNSGLRRNSLRNNGSRSIGLLRKSSLDGGADDGPVPTTGADSDAPKPTRIKDHKSVKFKRPGPSVKSSSSDFRKMFKKKRESGSADRESKSDTSLLSQLPPEVEATANIPTRDRDAVGVEDTERFLSKHSKKLSLDSARDRFIAHRASRRTAKDEFGPRANEGYDEEDPEDPFHGARRRLNEQRMRKMRRSGSSKTTAKEVKMEAPKSTSAALTEEHLKEHEHRVPEWLSAAREKSKAHAQRHSRHREDDSSKSTAKELPLEGSKDVPDEAEEHHRFRRHRHSKEHEREHHKPEWMSLSGQKNKFEAFRQARQLEKSEIEDGAAGSKMGNAVRRVSAQLMSNQEEREASSRRASWAKPDHRRPSDPRLAPSSSSPSPPDGDSVDQLDSLSPGTADPRLGLQMEMGDYGPGPQPSYIPPPPIPLYDDPDPVPRPPFAQGKYQPRAGSSFYRPTLSPVSSRSPVPTSVHETPVGGASGVEKVNVNPLRPVSSLPQLKEVPSVSSLSLPHLRSSESPTGTANIAVPKPGNLIVTNGLPLSASSSSSSHDSAPKSPLSPIQEASGSEVEHSRLATRQAAPAKDAVFSVLPGSRIKASWTAEHKPVARKPSPPKPEPSNSKKSSAPKPSFLAPQPSNSPPSRESPLSEVPRPPAPPPDPPPSPLRVAPKTPTASALDFWREADESLAPSESASAQPPNYRGMHEPSSAPFWRLADQSLDVRKSGPTMEEWIASLPGLGLGLGPWGRTDGTLDWKMFETLKASRKLNKSKKGSADGIESGKGSIFELLDRNIQRFEEAAEEIDSGGRVRVKGEGDALDEAVLEAGEEELADEEDNETALSNRPPPVTNPSLLHPEYRPGCAPPQPTSVSTAANANATIPMSWTSQGTGSKYVTQHRPSLRKATPQNKLGKDVSSRLDALESYWNEQGVVMGKVLKRMLVVVDNLIIKEREQQQKEWRRRQMGWFDEDEEEEREREAEDRVHTVIDAGEREEVEKDNGKWKELEQGNEVRGEEGGREDKTGAREKGKGRSTQQEMVWDQDGYESAEQCGLIL